MSINLNVFKINFLLVGSFMSSITLTRVNSINILNHDEIHENKVNNQERSSKPFASYLMSGVIGGVALLGAFYLQSSVSPSIKPGQLALSLTASRASYPALEFLQEQPSDPLLTLDIKAFLSSLFPCNLGPLIDYLPKYKQIQALSTGISFLPSPHHFHVQMPVKPITLMFGQTQCLNETHHAQVPPVHKFDAGSFTLLSFLAFVVAQVAQQIYFTPPSFPYSCFERGVTVPKPSIWNFAEYRAVRNFKYVGNYIGKGLNSGFKVVMESFNQDTKLVAKIVDFKVKDAQGTIKFETTIGNCLKRFDHQLSNIKSDWLKEIISQRKTQFATAYSNSDPSQKVSVQIIKDTYFGKSLKADIQRKFYEIMSNEYQKVIAIRRQPQLIINTIRSAVISATVAFCILSNYAFNYLSATI